MPNNSLNKNDSLAKLIVALDFNEENKAIALAKELSAINSPDLWVKVGLELFTAVGPSVIRELKKLCLKVFLDLKFHDIPNTVQGAVRSACSLGVDMCNIHASGGMRMAEAAVAGRADNCLLLGVTVLTSTSPEEIANYDTGVKGLASVALERAKLMKAAGLNGVVCSGYEVADIKKACGKDFICLCPGIRPASAENFIVKSDDQRRTMTPGEAISVGADFLVVGRPITNAASPAKAAVNILDSMIIKNPG